MLQELKPSWLCGVGCPDIACARHGATKATCFSLTSIPTHAPHRLEQGKGISSKARGEQGHAGTQPGPAPSPVQQPVGGELSCASHPGWALLDQIVGRVLCQYVSNCHWALVLQPPWCQRAPQCHRALGTHRTFLTSLVRLSSLVSGGRGFHLQLGCPVLVKQ